MGSPYGIDALADQQLAGGIMWLAGDIVFIGAILLVVAAWMRHEERDTSAAERRADLQRAALRERADRLALSREAAARPPGHRPPRAPAAPEPAGSSARGRRLGKRGPQQLVVALGIDVPAADHGDDRALRVPARPASRAPEPGRGRRQRAGWLHDQPRLLGDQPDGRGDLDLAAP